MNPQLGPSSIPHAGCIPIKLSKQIMTEPLAWEERLLHVRARRAWCASMRLQRAPSLEPVIPSPSRKEQTIPAAVVERKRVAPVTPLPETARPCLRCAAKGLRCSLEAPEAGQQSAVRCVRCARNAVDRCVQQADDAKSVPRECCVSVVPLKSSGPLQQDGRPPVVAAFVREPGVTADELAELAAEILRGRPVSVWGGVLFDKDVALPAWHRNDLPENRWKSECCHKTWQDFFRKRRAPKAPGLEELEESEERTNLILTVPAAGGRKEGGGDGLGIAMSGG